MKKLKIAAPVFVLILAGAGVYWKTRQTAKPGDVFVQRVVQAEQGPVEQTVEATGEVAPLNRVEIKPPIQGRIEKILTDEGSSVKSGDILAWMSSSDRAAILDAARAQGPEAAKKWEDTYKATPIVAPLSGVVILRNVVVGQTVDNGTTLFALSDKLIVLAQVDEVDIGRVKLGMPARVTLDAYPNQVMAGKVFNVLYEGVNVSNVITYGVKVALEKTPPFFRSQMTANVGFIIARKENAVLVPSAAVRNSPEGGKEVLAPGPDGKPVPQAVTVGLDTGDKAEITSGLSAGDSVVILQKKYSPQKAATSSPLVMGGSQQRGRRP